MYSKDHVNKKYVNIYTVVFWSCLFEIQFDLFRLYWGDLTVLSAGLTNKHTNSVIPVHVNQENCACVRYTVPCTLYVCNTVQWMISAHVTLVIGLQTGSLWPLTTYCMEAPGLYTVYHILYSVYCMIYTLHCILWTVQYIIYIVYCILYTLYCILYTVY